ncbi:uncharacterized protein LOC141719172 [Apium graveolens]|uniref:uncharacterized protein LOC141719172 n=1 Tax=Apium graveolens TaxID=4045 RepID=UPI003D7AD81C
MHSSIEILGKTKIPHNSWKQVTEDTKNEIQDCVQEKTKKQVSKGTVVKEGTLDVMKMALCDLEHPRRVRGQGSHVKQSVNFDLPKQKKVTSIDDKIREGVQKFWTKEVLKIVKERDDFWWAKMQKLKKEIISKTPGQGVS